MKRHADAACGFPDEIARPARTFAFDQESEGERNANGARNLETGTLSGKIAYRAIDHRSIVEQYLGASQDAIATYRSTFAHRLRLPRYSGNFTANVQVKLQVMESIPDLRGRGKSL